MIEKAYISCATDPEGKPIQWEVIVVRSDMESRTFQLRTPDQFDAKWLLEAITAEATNPRFKRA